MLLNPKRKTALIAFLAFDILAIVVFFSLYQMRSERQTVSELRDIGVTVYPEARALSDFQLLDQAGDVFSKSDFEGHWNLVFFGFTECPDICPLTMAELAQFYAGLDLDEVQLPRVFLVTVDPQRDTPESMAAYLAKYNEAFIGLSGDAQAIRQLADELYVAYGDAPVMDHSQQHGQEEMSEEEPMAATDYLISHSGHIAVINPQGDYYAVMRAPHRDRDLLKAYAEISK